MTSTVIATRGERLVLCSRPLLARRPGARGVPHRVAQHRRDRRRRADRGARHVRPRRLRRRLRGARRAIPRRRSGRPRAHVVGDRGVYAALNRHELPATTPDWVNVDHRRETAFAPGDLIAYLRAGGNSDQTSRLHIEAVHRLSDLGAVFTYAANGTSHEGFDAEWRVIASSTVDGDLINRSEVFDEADLDAALARFDELSRPTPRLENAASQCTNAFAVHFAARDWDAMAELLADDFYSDDRRRVVGAGVQHGRDAEIANMRTIADLWITNMTSTVIATRGERLALMRTHFSGRDQRARSIPHRGARRRRDRRRRADRRAASHSTSTTSTPPSTELDARYLAGEAAAHAHTWSVIAGAYAAFNRHELPATTPDWVNVDHRRAIAFAPGDMTAYTPRQWDLTPRPQLLHRGCASAEQPRCGRHPRVAWDLARGLRRRVARDLPLDGRRRPDQSLRGVRRGRPRHRAREIR